MFFPTGFIFILKNFNFYRVVLQLIYFSLAIWVTNNATTLCPLTNTGYGFPLPAWLLLVWPAPLIGLNELVKYYEIKYLNRIAIQYFHNNVLRKIFVIAE